MTARAQYTILITEPLGEQAMNTRTAVAKP